MKAPSEHTVVPTVGTSRVVLGSLSLFLPHYWPVPEKGVYPSLPVVTSEQRRSGTAAMTSPFW